MFVLLTVRLAAGWAERFFVAPKAYCTAACASAGRDDVTPLQPGLRGLCGPSL